MSGKKKQSLPGFDIVREDEITKDLLTRARAAIAEAQATPEESRVIRIEAGTA